MEVETRDRLLGLLFDWVLPILVVFSLEVVGYVLYIRYRRRQTQLPTPAGPAPSNPEKPKSEGWRRSLRLRSECSTDLNSDGDFLSSRQGSVETGGSGQDVLTHRSCNIPSRVAGLALDGVVLRRSTAPPTANRHDLPSGLVDNSPPRSYAASVCGETSRTTASYTHKDLLEVFCYMKKGGHIEGKSDATEACRSPLNRTHSGPSQAPDAPKADSADPASPSSDSRSPERLQGQSVASWESEVMQGNVEAPVADAAEGSPRDTDLEKREAAANNDARPLLHKALRFRQFDIASTIYMGFKHECLKIRPDTFVLLIQVALSSKAFATCADWLVELMKDSNVDADWLDRVIAAISVGAPLVLKTLLVQLEDLRKAGRLSVACSAVVAQASSYLALANPQAGVRAPTDCTPKETPSVMRNPPGLSLRTNRIATPVQPAQGESRPAPVLKPAVENQSSSRGLNPNAPEFVPVGPALTEQTQEDLQQTVLAHRELQQKILMLLQHQNSPCSLLSCAVTDHSPLPLQHDMVQTLEPTVNAQQTESAKDTQAESCKPEDKPAAEVRNSENAQPQEPVEAPVETKLERKAQQPEEPKASEQPKPQLTVQQQLQQHIERALLNQGAPPGLPPRRHSRKPRQGDRSGTQSRSASSPMKSNDAASRQRIAEVLISRIAQGGKTEL